MTQPTLHAPKLSRKEKYGYGIGAMGEGMAFNLVSSFFMIYCTDSLGISAGFIATFFFAARIWDALNDIMMGTLAENIHTKWGKHRPWILLGALLNAAVLVLLFNPTLARAGNVHLYIVVFYVLFDMTYTIIDVPYYAYAAAFTDAHERDQISAIPRILGGVGTIGIPALTLMMVQKLSPESQAQGFFRWAVLVAIFFVCCAFVATGTMKNRNIAAAEKKFTFREALSTLKNNEQLLAAAAVFVLAFVAVNMTTSVAVYYFKYVWQKPEAYAPFSIIAGAGMAVSLLAYPFLVKKFTRRKIFIASLILPIVGYTLMFVVSMLTKRIEFLLPVAFVLVSGYGCISILSSVFLADTVDYGEWKFGYRSENIIFSVLTLMGKFSGAISALLTGWGMQAGGYKPTAEETLGIAAEAAITQQPESVTTALTILMFAVPPLILMGALLLFVKKYHLHGAFLEKVQGELAQMRVERG